LQYFGIALPRSEAWPTFVAVNWDLLLIAALCVSLKSGSTHPVFLMHFRQVAAVFAHMPSNPQRTHACPMIF
jgi:hypothetical protein